jgi:glycosyltransferase involved in cell wall biosynthesis
VTITVHVVTSHFPPETGGLERWTCDLAHALAAAGFRPVVYVCEDGAAASFHRGAPFEVVDMGPLRALWEAPLGEGTRATRERARVAFACLRAEVARRMGPGPNVVLSNFVTTAGFTAHLAAEALDLPHVAVVAGTDFTRGFRNGDERPTFLEVCRGARWVVGKSEEQLRAIRRRLPRMPCSVIETSVEPTERRWRKPPGDAVTIFSDGGFSFKKGTGVLMDAFAALRARGVPARLVICGGDRAGEHDYWTARRRAMADDPSLPACFPGFLPRARIVDAICDADLYASATLGEGASAARALALCLGVPMVTTACGELAHDPGAAHVRLVPVADAAAFHDALHDVAAGLHAGRVTIDEAAVDGFRARFDPGREWTAWASLLRGVAADG